MSQDTIALAKELSRDVASGATITVSRLNAFAWAAIEHNDIGRLARALVDAPVEHAIRRALELAQAIATAATSAADTKEASHAG